MKISLYSLFPLSKSAITQGLFWAMVCWLWAHKLVASSIISSPECSLGKSMIHCCPPRITSTSKKSPFTHHLDTMVLIYNSLKRLICQNLAFLGSEWKSNILFQIDMIPGIPSLQCEGRTAVKVFRMSLKNDHKLSG